MEFWATGLVTLLVILGGCPTGTVADVNFFRVDDQCEGHMDVYCQAYTNPGQLILDFGHQDMTFGKKLTLAAPVNAIYVLCAFNLENDSGKYHQGLTVWSTSLDIDTVSVLCGPAKACRWTVDKHGFYLADPNKLTLNPFIKPWIKS